MTQAEIAAAVQQGLDQYAQYSGGVPVVAESGKKVLNVELNSGTATIGTVAISQITPGTTNGVQVNAALPAGTNNIGDVDVLSIAAGANVIGKFGVDQTTPGTTNFVQNKEMPDATATFAVTPYVSAALEASAVVKASAGTLYGFVFTNGNASTRYVQVFDATSLPANGAVPALTFPVPSGGVLPFDTGRFANFYSTGIVIANSTTQLTLTIGSADSLFYVPKS